MWSEIEVQPDDPAEGYTGEYRYVIHVHASGFRRWKFRPLEEAESAQATDAKTPELQKAMRVPLVPGVIA